MLKPTLGDSRRIGARLKSVRVLTLLSQMDFCKKYDFSHNSMRTWEGGRFLPRVDKLDKICDSLKEEGILNISPEWILTGKGVAPTMMEGATEDQSSQVKATDEEEYRAIQKESELFKSNLTRKGYRPIVVPVLDNLMHPYYSKGDFVGGMILDKCPPDKKLIGKDFLIEMSPSAFIIRRFAYNGYDLLLGNCAEPGLFVPIQNPTVAEILWHRRASAFAVS